MVGAADVLGRILGVQEDGANLESWVAAEIIADIRIDEEPAFFDADKGTLRAMITLCEVDFNEEPK